MAGLVDARQIAFYINGLRMTGFAPDTYIEITQPNDDWADDVGADGEGVLVAQNDDRGEATLRLMQSSRSNDLLTELYLAQRRLKTLYQLSIEDLLSGSYYVSPFAWIVKPTDAAFAKTAQTREWTIRAFNMEMITRGNSLLG